MAGYIITAIVIILIISTAILYGIFLFVFGTFCKRTSRKYSLPNSKQFDGIREKIKERIVMLDEKEHHTVCITSHDRKKLCADLFDGSKDTVILQMHGYRSHGIRDFCSSSFFWSDKGYTLLIPHQRGHGQSHGNHLTFGIKERYDVKSWTEYIVSSYGKDVKIILSGISMGAATVLMASELDLPDNVKGIIADCPYSSPHEIIMAVAKKRGFIPRLIYPFIRLGGLIFGGFDIESASPTEAVKNTDLPILIIHGDDDRFVPYEMGKEVYENCKSKKYFLTVEGAGHAYAYFYNPRAYEKALEQFISDIRI